jgi:murein L,D-transpeptidase YafK
MLARVGHAHCFQELHRVPSTRSSHAALRALHCVAAALALFANSPPFLAHAQSSAPPTSAIDDIATPLFRNPLESAFARAQLQHPRVFQARADARFTIKQIFRDRGIPYPASEIFMRVFKRERILELWVRTPGAQRFELLKEYRICALTGDAGPKRRQGDEQTPEGFYEIDLFNPNSQYLLSLHVNYPNSADRILGAGGPLGGDIYVHGGCKTLGCIAVEDHQIKELYWLAVEARALGQQRIPIHIFPARLDHVEMDRLAGTFQHDRRLIAFWDNLRPGFEFFERTRIPPLMRVDASGRYQLAQASINVLQAAAAETSVR